MALGVTSEAAGRPARRLFTSNHPHSEMALISSSRTPPLSPSNDDYSSSGNSSSDDDLLEVAVVDAASLDEQIQELRERVTRLEKDETDPELALGYERLAVRRRRSVEQAHTNHAMSQRRARAVFEHANARARERYAARCARLQQAMDDELARELQRLRNAQAGVAVSSRRRRGVRPSSSSSYNEPVNGAATAPTTGLLSPPLSTPSMLALTRGTADNSYYYYDGAAFPLPTSDADGVQDSDADDAAVDLSPGDLAQRVRFEEKKRLDALLARPWVFAPLDQKLTDADVDADVLELQHAVMRRCQRSSSLHGGRSSRCTGVSGQDRLGDKTAEERASATALRRRWRLKTTPSAPEKTGAGIPTRCSRPPAPWTSTRLRVNPQMLVEGQEVAVYRRRPLSSTTSADARDHSQETGDCFDVPGGRMECALSGVIAAATSTHVIILSVSGHFEPVAVADWAAGRVIIQAADTMNAQQRKRRRQELADVR